MIAHQDEELIQADDFVHVNVIPKGNTELKGGRGCVARNACRPKQVRGHPPPEELVTPALKGYEDLEQYLHKHYW